MCIACAVSNCKTCTSTATNACTVCGSINAGVKDIINQECVPSTG